MVVLVQITGHMLICMQQIDMWEVLLEFAPDVDLNPFCEALMDIEHWMGIPCHIRCETLDAEGLCAVRAKLWVPPAQDAEGVNPHDKQILPPLGPMGRIHLYDEEFARPGELTANPNIELSSVPFYPVYTAAVQDLGIHYQPMAAKYA